MYGRRFMWAGTFHLSNSSSCQLNLIASSVALSDPTGSSAKVKNDDIFGGAMVRLNRGSMPSSSINKSDLTTSAYLAIGFTTTTL